MPTLSSLDSMTHRRLFKGLLATVLFLTTCLGCGSESSSSHGSGSAPEPASAEETAHVDWLQQRYTKSEHFVPMRDGTRLYTLLYEPVDRSLQYPIMLFRTPYSIRPYALDEFRDPLGPSAEFDRLRYIYVFQDVRGKFKSEGDFEILRVPASAPSTLSEVDESTDNYDTIDWALSNVKALRRHGHDIIEAREWQSQVLRGSRGNTPR